MKGNMGFSKVQLFTALILLGVTIRSHAFKLPINLRQNPIPHQTEDKVQLQPGQDDNSSETMHRRSSDLDKALLFPKNVEDENVSTEYRVRLSFENQDEAPDNGNLKGLERFYKYILKSQPEGDQVIVFPKDAIGQLSSQKVSEGREEEEKNADFAVNSRSEGESVSPDVSAGIEESDESTNKSPSQIKSTEPTIQAYESSPETELDVREQSLYSGPKLRTQSSSEECPEGFKRNRNGSCQKPSRRFVT